MQTNTTGKWQEWLYVALAVAGFVGANAQVFGYLDLGFTGGTMAFWKDALTGNPASLFLVVDIFVLAAAVFIWMFAEGRRLGIGGGWLWAYFLGSVFIAISFAFPLFMAHRLRVIRLQNTELQSAPRGTDFIAIAFVVSAALAAATYSLMHMPT